ncbi:MAG: hypothetical protein P8Y36_08300 [Alphaproteobacteria bacterium]
MSTTTSEKSDSVQTQGRIDGESARRINQLVKEKWIPKSARNTISLSDGVQGYIAFLEDRHEKDRPTATDDELRAERARKLRLENDRTEGILIETDAAMNVIDEICATYRIGLGALPARVTRDLALRRKIEDEIDRILVTVADKFEDKAAILASDEDDASPEEDDAG